MRIEYDHGVSLTKTSFQDCQPGRIYTLYNHGQGDKTLRLCVQVGVRKLYMVELETGEQCNELDLKDEMNCRFGCEYVEVKDAVVVRGTA